MLAEIIDFLEDSGLSEVEEVKSTEDYIVVKFYYDFDNEELSGAKEYANSESDVEEESDEWYRDWYLSYLGDIANDNCQEIIEEVSDEFEIEGVCKALEMDSNTSSYIKFISVFNKGLEELDLEEILNDYF